MAKLLNIYVRPGKGQPIKELTETMVKASLGLKDDYFAKKDGKRQITILSNEAWSLACHELGQTLDPKLRRANLLVEGLDLKEAVGKLLQIGRAVIRIEGETVPCRLMDEVCSGLKKALASDWRGGVYGSVLADGYIYQGDDIKWVTGI